ncbi:MAG: glycosyltransferase family protein [Alphaproteobacteria bacterium]
MFRSDRGSRILIYSHDTFGLGHLRRCRAIAHNLVGTYSNLSILIMTGSPIIGAFDFRARVDFVRVPGVIKLREGDYTSLSLHIDIEDTVRMREAIMARTAEAFDPDIFLVDKEPLGMRGEIETTLAMLKQRGTRLVLGLRDVLDDPELLAPEWERKHAMRAVETLYDEVWVYGHREIHDPLACLDPSPAVLAKTVFTGYLPRTLSEPEPLEQWPEITRNPYLLVTTGGGGDGEGLIDWVLTTYETQGSLPLPALLVLGPFMPTARQIEFRARASKLKNVHAIVFHNRVEQLIASASAVVAMGGYNTFCEVMTFDRPTLIVPRTVPRREQLLRAETAERAGLLAMLTDPVEAGTGLRDPASMATELRKLMNQPKPSQSPTYATLLSGFDVVAKQVLPWLHCRSDADGLEQSSQAGDDHPAHAAP